MNETRAARPRMADGWVLALIVAGGMLVQLPGLFWGVPGGKAINNALRILEGDIPYRDFWTMYAPGHFYVGALLFKLFGVHVWVNGLGAQLFTAADAALVFLIAIRLGARRSNALGAAAVFLAVMWRPAPELDSYVTSLLFLLLAVERVIQYVNQRTTSSLLLAGAWCGVAAWFKHDVAFHVTAGITAGLIAAWLVLPAARRSEWMSPLGVLLRVPGAAFLTLLPVMVLLVGTAWPDVWNALIVFPATDFRIVRGQAYPPLLPRWSWVAGWLVDPGDPARLAGLFRNLATWIKANVLQLLHLTALVVLIRQRRTIDARALCLSLVALAAMPFFWASAHVQHNTHFHSLWLLSMLLGALVWRHAPPAAALRRFAAVLLVLFGGALLEIPARLVATALYQWPTHRVLEVPSAAGVRLPGPEYAAYQPIASFIRTHVPDTEPIYVGLLRHDAVVISNQAFYYLAGRPVASRYNELHPGITDREEVQREIIGDLDRLGVRCAVLWKFGWPADRMDRILADRRRQLPELGATLLDEYFRQEFREIERFGEYTLMWRRDAPLMERRDSTMTTGSEVARATQGSAVR